MKDLSLSPEVRERIDVLAKEGEVAPEVLIGELVEAEDKKRHVRVNAILYGEGEKRFRCSRKDCPEKVEAPNALEEVEIGG